MPVSTSATSGLGVEVHVHCGDAADEGQWQDLERMRSSMTIVDGSSRRGLRAQVAASWQCAPAAGVAPDASSDPVIDTDGRLDEARRSNPLLTHVDEIRAALAPDGLCDDHLLGITDPTSTILWIAGSPALRRRIASIGMVEGAHWGEIDVGANAIGAVLHDQCATLIIGAERLVTSQRPWQCAAEAVRDPGTGEVVASLNIAAPVADGHSIALAAVRAGARFAERLLAASPRPVTAEWEPPTVDLQLLGPAEPTAYGVQLTARRADILALLADSPEGLAADTIAYRLFGDDGKAATIRAEIHRIRQQFPGLVVGQPYRLAAGVRTDIGLVRALTAGGDALGAVAAYSGELLPRSQALEIEMMRSELRQAVRACAIGSGGRALASWCSARGGWDDLEAIERRLGELPADDGARELLVARRNRLLRKYA